MTVAPTGEDVTGILCVLLRVSVAQFGDSRTLMSVRRRSRAAFFLHMGPSLSYTKIYQAKGKAVKVLSILEALEVAGCPDAPPNQKRRLFGGSSASLGKTPVGGEDSHLV
jgi:hypothetical protein